MKSTHINFMLQSQPWLAIISSRVFIYTTFILFGIDGVMNKLVSVHLFVPWLRDLSSQKPPRGLLAPYFIQ